MHVYLSEVMIHFVQEKVKNNVGWDEPNPDGFSLAGDFLNLTEYYLVQKIL